MQKPHTVAVLFFAQFLLVPGTGFAKKFTLTIRFIKPVSDGIIAKCEAVTSNPRLKVLTGDQVKWKIKKDEDDDAACPYFDADKVSLDFTAAGIVNDDATVTPSSTVKGHKRLGDDRAEGTVVAKQRKEPYKYQVLFDGELAQDPELDVSGTLPPVPETATKRKGKKKR